MKHAHRTNESTNHNESIAIRPKLTNRYNLGQKPTLYQNQPKYAPKPTRSEAYEAKSKAYRVNQLGLAQWK